MKTPLHAFHGIPSNRENGLTDRCLMKASHAFPGYLDAKSARGQDVRQGWGKWKHLFRAIHKHGRLIDFMLTDRRNTAAAHRFLGKALTAMRHWPPS
jgi:hypothetical protein